MSILNNLFGKKVKNENSNAELNSTIELQELTSLEQVGEIIEESKSTLVGIFKHSTRCIISKTVLKQFEEAFSKDLPIKMYYLDLLNYRNISNEIAERFQVIHQSPQLLIIRNGIVATHASHYDIITQIDLQELAK